MLSSKVLKVKMIIFKSLWKEDHLTLVSRIFVLQNLHSWNIANVVLYCIKSQNIAWIKKNHRGVKNISSWLYRWTRDIFEKNCPFDKRKGGGWGLTFPYLIKLVAGMHEYWTYRRLKCFPFIFSYFFVKNFVFSKKFRKYFR